MGCRGCVLRLHACSCVKTDSHNHATNRFSQRCSSGDSGGGSKDSDTPTCCKSGRSGTQNVDAFGQAHQADTAICCRNCQNPGPPPGHSTVAATGTRQSTCCIKGKWTQGDVLGPQQARALCWRLPGTAAAVCHGTPCKAARWVHQAAFCE